MKKNTKLFIVLIVLIAVSISLALIDTGSKRNSFEVDIFQVSDTATIQSISIKGDGINNVIEKNDGQWVLNGNYKTDESLIKIISTILSQVVIKRPVAKLSNLEILEGLKNNGREVTILQKDGSKISFLSGGNDSKTTSYFANLSGDQVYIVEIPGYKNYISGIFELTENQWRDRLIFSTSWRTLKTLSIDYKGKPNFHIAFEDRFLKVGGVDKMDTTALLEYLEQYQYFQINDYLDEGDYPKYDSLLKTNPFANITISDIDDSRNKSLMIFPKMQGERFYLLTDEAKEMMVVDEKRMESLLVSPEQFKSD